jgi:hypothetical protein
VLGARTSCIAYDDTKYVLHNFVPAIVMILAQKGPKHVANYNSIFDSRHILYVMSQSNPRQKLKCSNYHLTSDTETTIKTDGIISNTFHR